MWVSLLGIFKSSTWIAELSSRRVSRLAAQVSVSRAQTLATTCDARASQGQVGTPSRHVCALKVSQRLSSAGSCLRTC